MQQFVYHIVPAEMIGEKLIPLNSLGKVHPPLYEKYAEKYYDHPERSKLLKNRYRSWIACGMMSFISFHCILIMCSKH